MTKTKPVEQAAIPVADKLLRLPAVLERVPVSPATWWKGVKAGKFPAGLKLGPRTTCWRSSDIDALIQPRAQ